MTFQKNDFSTLALTGSGSVSLTSPSQSIAVVVPCYNEAKRLDLVTIVAFLRDNRHVEMIFVNDGSSDATLEVLLSIRSQVPAQVTVIDLARNGGKAEAVRQGLLYASTTHAGLVAYWDADLATPLDAIEDFARIARRHSDIEVIFGSRREMLGHKVRRTLGRKIISHLNARLARLALQLPIADTQCGAKMIRNSAALSLAIAKPFTAGWLFDVELFARLSHHLAAPTRAFFEFPLSQWDEVPGSKVTPRAVLRAGFRMLGLIAELRLGLKCPEKPMPGNGLEGVAKVFASGLANAELRAA